MSLKIKFLLIIFFQRDVLSSDDQNDLINTLAKEFSNLSINHNTQVQPPLFSSVDISSHKNSQSMIHKKNEINSSYFISDNSDFLHDPFLHGVINHKLNKKN
jgi:hypothetical protein